uniref:AMP-dependent synthetase/ligase domain-containing protein n=1 Tax=Alexandrium monilatum TaxID=311494 RepID=A0A7S4SRQ6_9DINO
MGVGVGDRLVTIVDNRPELVVLLLSCLKLGVTFVPLATDLRPCDCQGMVARYEPSLIVCDQMQCAPFARKDGGNFRSIVLPPFGGNDNQLKQMMSEGSDQPIQIPDVPAGVPSTIFTSGSTTLPKGVMYSHVDLAGLGSGGGPWPDSAMRDCTKHLMWVSMRGAGGTVILLKHLLQGVMTVMVDSYPSGPEIWGRLIEKHGLDSHILFGAALNQTMQQMPDRRFESVRTILYRGCCFAPTLIQRSMEQLPNAIFVQAYGMTGVYPISILGGDFHKRAGEASEQDMLRMSSAGNIVAPGSVFIEDLDQPGSGKVPPPEKDGVGQVCARCNVTMMGYFADPEKTLEAMPDGKFVRTGDVGRIDEDGFLYILGRVKDIIPAYKGFNVTPRDVEEVLYSHPCVGQASVVGVWHPSGAGEAVVAWARAKAGAQLRADNLRGHLERAGMPHWQLPEPSTWPTSRCPPPAARSTPRR